MIETQASSFDRISPTALMTAYARQFTDIPYSKELADLLNAKTVVEQMSDETFRKAIEIEGAVRVESRYKAINQVMSQFEAVQIIELASGVLPRGMSLSQNPNVTFVESDLPKMIRRKQELVTQLIGERPNLHLIEIDATAQPSQFPLDADYLESRKPVVILCEGLLGYLTFAQKRQVFENVREMLRVYGGVWITSDLHTLDRLNKYNTSSEYRKLIQTIQCLTGSNVNESNFANFEQVERFSEKQGFYVESHDMLGLLEKLTCLQSLNISPEVAKSILENSLVSVLALRDT